MKYIQERLGHDSMQITADVYSHVSKEIEKDRMEKFEEYTKKFLVNFVGDLWVMKKLKVNY